ncbi:Leucine--tRNA ligase [Candidatus Hartigia pinicola]|nr:Leucine--tRNA ligase [Candidatus Hartigia pinicola]
MQKQYCPEDIEPKIQRYWNEQETFKVTEDASKEKYYCLSMLPYPSGRLHMGHVRNYTIGDVISRYQRLLGKNVLQPIGWDAFGLPAEGAAIKNNTAPALWTYANIDYMKCQLKILGFSFDWSREITTCTPEYYRWEQWFFTILYEKGLVYKKESEVNWCPNDLTVLANEQVIDQCCWRCDTPVERKKIPQWFIKITAYAEELLNDLNNLDDWPEKVKMMQRNWIGRSERIEVTFNIIDSNEKLMIYISCPHIFMGATYVAIAPEHPLAKKIAMKNVELSNFINQYRNIKKFEIDTTTIGMQGVSTGLHIIHPLTQETLPIWVASFIGIEHGTDVIMASPSHEKRHWEFANKYHLPLKTVLSKTISRKTNILEPVTTKTSILTNSEKVDTLNNISDFNAIVDKLVAMGLGQRKIHYRLRDWGVSRQRYWGAPIPMATLENGTLVPIPKDKLPIILPEYAEINSIISPIKSDPEWAKITINEQPALCETDTFDTFIESSWYYARYTCPRYNKGMLDSKAANYWLPVDQYIGGIEHAVMHLMYFRFFHKLMRDVGLVNSNEPAKRLLCEGMVLADTFYYTANNGQRVWVSAADAIIERDKKNCIIKACDTKGHKLVYIGMRKMSKSKNNGVDPKVIVEKYGADTVRLFMMFSAPPELSLEWKESSIEGASRFIRRVWRLVYEHSQKGITQPLDMNTLTTKQRNLRRDLHKTIAKVTDDFSHRYAFNTAIAAIMEFINKLIRVSQDCEQDRALIQESLEAITLMLSPIIPHACFEIWTALGRTDDINFATWPIADAKAMIDETKLLVIQVNGKVRGCITVPIHSDQKFILDVALKERSVLKHLKGMKIRKVIDVPGKLLNLVVS